MSSVHPSKAETIGTLDFNRRMIRLRPAAFGIHTFFTLLVFGMQLVPGLIVKAVFDAISGAAPAPLAPILGPNALGWLIGLYVLAEVARLGLSFGSEWYGWTFRLAVSNLLRRNLFASILHRPGDRPLPVSPGEAVNRFQTDVEEVADFPTWLPDQLGKWIAAGIAIAIMARINLPITLVIFIPLVFIMLLTRLAWGRIIYYDRVSAEKTDRVSGFLGETFGAVQSVKVANAEERAAGYFQQLSEERARAAIRKKLFWDLLNTLNESVVSFGVGVVLLLAGTAISAGSFTVGDFALFVSYLWFTTQVPSELGTFYGDFKTQEVSIERMLEMVRPEPAGRLVEQQPPGAAVVPTAPAGPFESLEARGLTFRFPDWNGSPANGAGRREGIEGIDLTVRRGEFVVITGRVGAGKSTLVRVLLGLLPKQSGEIRWNGTLVENPAEFMRPPRCAYTPQVPRLFSDTLRENLLMGLPAERVDLAGAIAQSVLEEDAAGLENGLDTLVGPRGMRLSGGQVQRAAAARMFARRPELLVFDDLSSALDAHTEQALWERLDAARQAGQAMTCLVVSHRRAALRRAERILVLKNGRLIAEGRLDELLESCEEMRRLWMAEGKQNPGDSEEN